jgi:hypothetical protein
MIPSFPDLSDTAQIGNIELHANQYYFLWECASKTPIPARIPKENTANNYTEWDKGRFDMPKVGGWGEWLFQHLVSAVEAL